MKKLMLAAGFLFLSSVAGFAQDTEEQHGQGYAFFAPTLVSGVNHGLMHVGGGGEALIRRVGIGGEIGYLTPWESLSSGIGVGSLNGSFNLRPGRISPFLTGGYTLYFRGGTANGYNFGGGVNYWLNDRTGLRFEVRDNVLPDYYKDLHQVGLRIGVTFR